MGKRRRQGTRAMTDRDGKVEEVDRLLNDPEVPMEALRVWELLDEIAGRAEAGD